MEVTLSWAVQTPLILLHHSKELKSEAHYLPLLTFQCVLHKLGFCPLHWQFAIQVHIFHCHANWPMSRQQASTTCPVSPFLSIFRRNYPHQSLVLFHQENNFVGGHLKIEPNPPMSTAFLQLLFWMNSQYKEHWQSFHPGHCTAWKNDSFFFIINKGKQIKNQSQKVPGYVINDFVRIINEWVPHSKLSESILEELSKTFLRCVFKGCTEQSVAMVWINKLLPWMKYFESECRLACTKRTPKIRRTWFCNQRVILKQFQSILYILELFTNWIFSISKSLKI